MRRAIEQVARSQVKAGPHQLGVTFVKNPSSLIENARQPYNAHFNHHRHPRLGPAIYQISINGPYDSTGPGQTVFNDAFVDNAQGGKGNNVYFMNATGGGAIDLSDATNKQTVIDL